MKVLTVVFACLFLVVLGLAMILRPLNRKHTEALSAPGEQTRIVEITPEASQTITNEIAPETQAALDQFGLTNVHFAPVRAEAHMKEPVNVR